MDSIKTLIIGVGFGDLNNNSNNRTLFAEVVLLDKTTESLMPVLYQLNNEIVSKGDLATYRKDIRPSHESFMMVGEVATIDKKKKIIYLSNGDTVLYNHLIVASGKQAYSDLGQGKTFINGLQALIDALRVTAAATDMQSAKLSLQQVSKLVLSKIPESIPAKEVHDLLHHKILKEAGAQFSLSLNGVEKKLFEVCL